MTDRDKSDLTTIVETGFDNGWEMSPLVDTFGVRLIRPHSPFLRVSTDRDGVLERAQARGLYGTENVYELDDVLAILKGDR